ncbi:energy transducer TonB [Methylobacter sp. YRD-M1]|uniref:energy transducer TonB n=1 Tax=Methylobacter sp. YRD-M1 TaxID=2911520 RepID=UPI00227BECCC|nr:energy transducer TonB [Methylobacter sp. YRD-M1]WAK03687.1 energy transducer TonB [Methylobacter sp. YRD-M1]
MSVHTQQVIPFPSAARAEAPVCSAVTVLFDALCDRTDRFPQTSALSTHLPETMPACQWSEGLIGLGAALALHLAWLAVLPASEKPAPLTLPTPIQVQWIASAQSHADLPKPAPQKPQATRKPIAKPKAKPRRSVPVKPKPLLSAPDSTTEMAVAETINMPKTPVAISPPSKPAATPAPVNSKPAIEAPLSLPHLNAEYLHNPAPVYPMVARRLGQQGKVLLHAMINTDGAVAQLDIHKTSGFSRLDQAALETVKHWRFVPARRGGQAVAAWVIVPISFTLEG